MTLISFLECQGGIFAPSGTYSPPFNDVWSLGIILLNLITGRNPWKSASPSDPTFHAYLQEPANFLPSVLPISAEVNEILLRTLDVDWRTRITIAELRFAIKGVNSFYAEDAVFEGSMARCSWEVGIDITGSSTPEDEPAELPKKELKSVWSQESGSQMVFAAHSETDKSWTEEPSSATWGADSALRSRSPSPSPPELSTSYEIYDDRRTPSSSSSMYSPALSEPSLSNRYGDSVNYNDPSGAFQSRVVAVDSSTQAYERSVFMRSADSSAMHTALESLGPGSSPIFVSMSKPSYTDTCPSAIDVGMSSMGDYEQVHDSMSWTQASYEVPPRSDALELDAPTQQATENHAQTEETGWRDFCSSPVLPSQPQGSLAVSYPMVSLVSSPATTASHYTPTQVSTLRERSKPRSSSFFNPIKLAFPRPDPSPLRSAQKSTTSLPQRNPSPLPRPRHDHEEGTDKEDGTVVDHTRRRRRRPLRTARDWLFSGRFFAVAGTA